MDDSFSGLGFKAYYVLNQHISVETYLLLDLIILFHLHSICLKSSIPTGYFSVTLGRSP
jgi:hypothetical protein